MDGDSIPRSLIYAQVAPEHIADVNWIMEGYEFLANVLTVDGSAGILKFAATPDTYDEVINALENMPFEVNLLDSFVD